MAALVQPLLVIPFLVRFPHLRDLVLPGGHTVLGTEPALRSLVHPAPGHLQTSQGLLEVWRWRQCVVF